MALTKVTRSGITDNSVNAAKIEDGTIVDADITPGTITVAKLAGTLDLSSKTVTLPNTSVTNDMLAGSIANAKLANSTITINGAATALGGSVSAGSIAWQSVVVSDGSTVTTMVAGRGYFVNNTSAAGIVKLPISASAGDTIAIKDYAGNFATNKLTIQRNGHNIQGVANDSQIGTNRASIILVYIDATKGWLYTNESNVGDLGVVSYISATGGTVTTTGDFKTHVFTGDGNFVVATTGLGAGPSVVDYFVVAGGGGGYGDAGAGAGAGGFRLSNSYSLPTPTMSPLVASCGISVSVQTYPITVGGGGSGGGPGFAPGSNSVFSTITSAGGGKQGTAGGSGGGGRANGPNLGGAGNTPPVSPPQGNRGGNNPYVAYSGGAGGGGAGGQGVDKTGAPTGSPGGPGSYVSDTFFGPTAPSYGEGGPVGSTRYFAGGGGSSYEGVPGPAGSGGVGGGGNGGTGGGSTAGSANTGGGAGGDGAAPGKGGGSGIVVLRYKFQN